MKQFEGKFHLEFGEPVVIEQGAPDDREWGHYQFPGIYRTEKGDILAKWSYYADTIEHTSHLKPGIRNRAVSEDNGKTWRDVTPEDVMATPMMKNGKYFAGFCGMPVHRAEYLSKYTPAVTLKTTEEHFIHIADEIEETEDKTFSAMEKDPVTGETTTFPCTVNWPYMPLSEHTDRRVYPTMQYFTIRNKTGLITIDGDLYYVMYAPGLNSDAKTREEAIWKYAGYTGAYVFKSTDCGRTWDYLSQVLINDEVYSTEKYFEGFSEPKMAVMPDGSVVMLLRTGTTHPSYIVRSTDNCKSWSKPVKFDDCGVQPQLLTLSCGVTLATYGRPVLKVRATGDPAGLQWEDPIEMDLYGMKNTGTYQRSCFYTRLLPLDDSTALMTYADFEYPNADGEGVKTILVRTVTVVKD